MLNFHDQLDFSPVKKYLLENVNEWVKENPNLGEKYPLSLHCGIFLGKELGINKVKSGKMFINNSKLVI